MWQTASLDCHSYEGEHFEQEYLVILACSGEFLGADKWGDLNLWNPNTRIEIPRPKIPSLLDQKFGESL